MKKLLTIVLAVALVALVSVAGADVVSVNMGSNEQSLLANDVAGVVAPQDNWNNAPGSGPSNLSNLVDDDGDGTTVDVAWQAHTTWHVGNGTATGDAKMMTGYLDKGWGDGGDRDIAITLSEIPYATYDLYVYVGGSNTGAMAHVIRDSGAEQYSFTNDSIKGAFTSADYSLTTTADPDVFPAANYAIFAGLTSSSVSVTLDHVSQGGLSCDEVTGIFGVQIVSDPLASKTKAWGPAPVDEATNIALNTGLSWYVPLDANALADTDWTYEVYFDTDSTFASTTPITVGPHVGGNHLSVSNAQIGGALDAGTYFWRVDAVEPNTPPVTNTGDVWSFTAGCTLPTLIDPNNTYTEVVEIDVDLEWSSDPLAITHNVVITPDGGSPYTAVNQTSPYNPWNDLGEPAMAWDKQYTWQIKEYDAGSVLLADGPVWQFKVRALSCDVSMTADIDGSEDCIVNLADFAALASQWLDCKWDDGGKNSPCP